MILFQVDEELEKNGKTRYWLEKETGLGYLTIKRIADNDTVAIKLDTLERICIALECNTSDIMIIKKRKTRKVREKRK